MQVGAKRDDGKQLTQCSECFGADWTVNGQYEELKHDPFVCMSCWFPDSHIWYKADSGMNCTCEGCLALPNRAESARGSGLRRHAKWHEETLEHRRAELIHEVTTADEDQLRELMRAYYVRLPARRGW